MKRACPAFLRLAALVVSVLLFLFPSPGLGQAPCSTCGETVVSDIDIVQPAQDTPQEQRALRLLHEVRQAWRLKDWQQVGPAADALIQEFPGTTWEARARAIKGLRAKFDLEWDAAMAEFDRVLALNPPQRLAHDVQTSRACILLSRGRFDEALGILETVRNQTRDRDQIKYVNAWLREAKTRQALQRHTRLGACGSRALAKVLQLRGREVSDDALADAFGMAEGEVMVSLGAMQSAGVKLGLEALAVKLPFDLLTRIETPLVALLKPGHYVVIVGRDAQAIEVHDPDRGRMDYTPERLSSLWTGYALVFDRKVPDPGIVLAAREDLERIQGGGCPCCTQQLGSNSGGAEATPEGPGGPTPGDPPPDCSPGMPHLTLSMATLNLMIKDMDFTYTPRLGPTVAFRRRYNNDSSYDGAFGFGWTHGYGLTVADYGTQAQVTRDSGRIDVYVALGNGAYDPPPGVNDALTQMADDSFTLEVWAEKLRYEFTADGRLERIVDRSDQSLSMGYYDNTPQVSGSSGGPAPGYLKAPSGVAVDATGTTYVADTSNDRLQFFGPDGAPQAPFGTRGSAPGQFISPADVAIDPDGNLYVADAGNNRIQKISADGSQIWTWGTYGNGPGQFSSPSGVAVGGSAGGGWALFVADSGNHRVQKLALDGTFQTMWGGGGSLAGQFIYPYGIDATDASVYVADTSNHRIQKFDPEGNFQLVWGSPGSGLGELSYPWSLAVNTAAGLLFVGERGNHRVQHFDVDGTAPAVWGAYGAGEGQFNALQGIAVDPFHVDALLRSTILVGDTGNNRLQRLDQDGIWQTTLGSGGVGPGVYKRPLGVALDGDGSRYIADNQNYRIVKYDVAGQYQWERGTGSPKGLAYDQAVSLLYVADGSTRSIVRYAPDGTLVGAWPLPANGSPYGRFRDHPVSFS